MHDWFDGRIDTLQGRSDKAGLAVLQIQISKARFPDSSIVRPYTQSHRRIFQP